MRKKHSLLIRFVLKPILLALFSIGLAGCGVLSPAATQSPAMVLSPTATQNPIIDLPFDTMENAQSPGTGKYYEGDFPKMVVITQVSDLAELDGEISTKAFASLSKDFDYQSFFAAVLFLGWGHPWSSEIKVQQVKQEGNLISITVKMTFPGPGVEVLDMEASPYTVIEVKKGTLKGNFRFLLLDTEGNVLPQTFKFL